MSQCEASESSSQVNPQVIDGKERSSLDEVLRQGETGVYAGPAAERVKVTELLDELIEDFENNDKSVTWVRYVVGHLRPFFGHMRAARVQT